MSATSHCISWQSKTMSAEANTGYFMKSQFVQCKLHWYDLTLYEKSENVHFPIPILLSLQILVRWPEVPETQKPDPIFGLALHFFGNYSKTIIDRNKRFSPSFRIIRYISFSYQWGVPKTIQNGGFLKQLLFKLNFDAFHHILSRFFANCGSTIVIHS